MVSRSPTSQAGSLPAEPQGKPVWMWELDYKESWVPKNWCFWTVVLEKTLESPLDCKEIKQVNPKGNQSWIFIGRIDAETEAPIFWPPDVKSWLIRKDPDSRQDWRQEEKGTTKDEMAGWHHWLDGHEFRWTPEVGDGQGGLACCNSRGRKESDTTERPNWTELKREPGRFYIVWALKSLWMVIAASKLKHTCSLEEKLWKSWCWNWSSNTSATWC